MTGMPSNKDTEKSGVPSLFMDWEIFAHHLAESEATDQEKEQAITAIWELIITIADSGFDIQSAQKPCEQLNENRIILPDDLLESLQDTPSNQIQNADDGRHPHLSAEEES